MSDYRNGSTRDGWYYGQVTYEKGFKSKADAEAWTREQTKKLEIEGKADSISTSIWEPTS